MKHCQRCEEAFPTFIEIEGKVRNLCSRKYCLECSPFGEHNTRKLENPVVPTEKACALCGETRGKEHFYVRGGGRGGLASYCKECHNTKSSARISKTGLQRRYNLIMNLGGACSICGYSKNIAAIQFHHKDPNTKSFNLDSRSCRGYRWETLTKEANKCILLCSVCHMETHHPECDMEELFRSFAP